MINFYSKFQSSITLLENAGGNNCCLVGFTSTIIIAAVLANTTANENS